MINEQSAGIAWQGESSQGLGLTMIYGDNQWGGANYSSTLTQIPGYSAASISPNGRYDNISQVFGFQKQTATPLLEVAQLSRDVSQWLFPTDPTNYKKLIIDASPDYYYMAVPTTISEFAVQVRTAISFSVTFSLVPYAYETGSDKYQAVRDGLVINNPRLYSALPLWHVKGTGNGSFVLNGVTYNFLGLNGDLYVDSDTEEVYDAANNYQPSMVQFDNYAFPVLTTGKNTFGTLTNITLEVMPRWRTLI
ncbi:hypothetical protein [Schleiferilactobacillus harbinensis]|jgi:phage-related protein|uniref:hypothetical protein n=1 Tax=Schleiferilactobacillus harbinensis TaxID=304207 RepID=UPI0026728DDA|nr:hypothetical protein [Schleiferilactobacillus harbinensis]